MNSRSTLPPRLDGSDYRGIRSRFHRRGPVAVDAHQRRLLAVLGQVRHHGQRHVAAAGAADALAGQIAQTAPSLLGVPHHDVQLFMAALDALDLHAVEVGAQLRPYGGRRQSRRFPGRGELDLQVPLAERQAVGDLVDARHRGQDGPQLGGRFPERLRVVVLQRVRDARPGPKACGLELHLFQMRELADVQAPRPLDLRGRRLAHRCTSSCLPFQCGPFVAL